MKLFNTSLKILSAGVLIILLANCASKSFEEVVEVETEVTKITITGSRIKRTETEAPVQVMSPPAKMAEQLQSERIDQLSAVSKEQLYRTIDNSREASGQIFKQYRVNPTIQTEHNPVSTFSMDADNGSFKLASAMLKQNQLPDPDGIRIEEFVNSMEYQYNQNEQLFSISAEAMPSPFRSGYHILHLGLQTKKLSDGERNPSNLVLVADVSGSMASDNKLELLKDAMTTLVSQLNRDDQIALVVYNDNASVVLEPTKASDKRKIFAAISQLVSGGSTNAEQGLLKGYELAESMYQPGFNNRVILTSDGMANVGSTSPEAILAKISESKDRGIFLTTLGVGLDMYNDHLLEQLANQGNGNYLYIANQQDIQQAFVDELNSQLQTVAKDAKIQVTFDPEIVSNYRLLGYENRHLNQQDFTDANKDGGEINAGHRVTALYEIKLSQQAKASSSAMANIGIAYKKPQGSKVLLINKSIPQSIVRNSAETSSPDSRLSFAVAAFAEKLRQSYWARLYTYDDIDRLLASLPAAYLNLQQVSELRVLISAAQRIDSRNDSFEQKHPIAKINFDRVPLLD